MDFFKHFIIQFIKFSFVGISNTLVSMLFYYLFTFFGIHYIMANTAGFLFGTLNAYILNSKYVFPTKDEKQQTIKTGTKVFISYGLTFILSTLLLTLLVQVIGISKYIAPIINICITTPLNFLLNKFWAFRCKK